MWLLKSACCSRRWQPANKGGRAPCAAAVPATHLQPRVRFLMSQLPPCSRPGTVRAASPATGWDSKWGQMRWAIAATTGALGFQQAGKVVVLCSMLSTHWHRVAAAPPTRTKELLPSHAAVPEQHKQQHAVVAKAAGHQAASWQAAPAMRSHSGVPCGTAPRQAPFAWGRQAAAHAATGAQERLQGLDHVEHHSAAAGSCDLSENAYHNNHTALMQWWM
jgi:hypothetical protein